MMNVYTVVAVVAATLLGSAVGVDVCNEDIIRKLGEIPECYSNGKPPSLLASGNLGTHIRMAGGTLPPSTKCVTATGYAGGASVTVYLTDGRNFPFSVKQEPQEGHYLLETDPTGKVYPKDARYRLYVAHNDANVYTYYRCTEDNVGVEGGHMVDIAVGCKHTTDQESLAVINKAMICFEKLGIKESDIKHYEPCQC